MILEIPFAYKVRVIPPKCRNPHTVRAFGTVLADIQEVTASEAPLLATVFRTGENGTVDTLSDPILYRSINGKLVRSYSAGLQVPSPHIPGSSPHMMIRTTEETAEDIDRWPTFLKESRYGILDLGTGMLETGKPENVIEGRRFIDNERDTKASETRALVQDGAAFVDGMLFVPSTGPVIMFRNAWTDILTSNRQRMFFEAGAEWKHRRLTTHDRIDHAFPAHEIEWLRDICLTGRLPDSIFGAHAPFEMNCPSLVVTDPEALRLAASSSSADAALDFRLRLEARELLDIAESFVGSWPPSDIEHYSELKMMVFAGNPDMKELQAKKLSVIEPLIRHGSADLKERLQHMSAKGDEAEEAAMAP